MVVGTKHGDTCKEQELQQWMQDAGLVEIRLITSDSGMQVRFVLIGHFKVVIASQRRCIFGIDRYSMSASAGVTSARIPLLTIITIIGYAHGLLILNWLYFSQFQK